MAEKKKRKATEGRIVKPGMNEAKTHVKRLSAMEGLKAAGYMSGWEKGAAGANPPTATPDPGVKSATPKKRQKPPATKTTPPKKRTGTR